MDAPRCLVCGTRHWSRQPCPAMQDEHAKQRRLQLAQKLIHPEPNPETKTPNSVISPPEPKPLPVISPKPEPKPVISPLTPHPDCPVCNARRERQRLATAKWRAK